MSSSARSFIRPECKLHIVGGIVHVDDISTGIPAKDRIVINGAKVNGRSIYDVAIPSFVRCVHLWTGGDDREYPEPPVGTTVLKRGVFKGDVTMGSSGIRSSM